MHFRLVFFTLYMVSGIAWSQQATVFSTTLQKDVSYGYVLQSPNATRSAKPLLVFLHGSGERGNSIDLVSIHGPLKYAATNPLDAYVLAPQCPENEYWNEEVLYRLISKIVAENNIDSQRIYLTGLSMGAWGAWNLVCAYPSTFAAVVPIAGFVDRLPMIEACALKNIPIKMYHGLLDDVVSVDYSIDMYSKLKKCNSNVSLIIFDDANHDSWSRVYNSKDIYDWLFAQIKIN